MSASHRTRSIVRHVNSGWSVVWFLLLASPWVSAISQHEVFTNAVPFSTDDLKVVRGLHQDNATLDNPTAAMELIREMRKVQGDDSCPLTADETKQKSKRDTHCLPELDGKHPNNYVLIHLVRWENSATADKPKLHADHWYLYRDTAPHDWSQEDFTSGKRLQGVTRTYVLYVHFKGKQTGADGKPVDPAAFVPGTYIPNYDLTITKKTPANVAHLYALLQAFAGGANATSASSKGAVPNPDAVWGGGILNIQYRPSDILIKSTFKVTTDQSDQKLADDTTFDNEGPYYWDVGFAIPVRKISELKLDATSGTATPAKVNSQNVFAVLDGYFRPVDVKGSAFNAIPHPIAGVAFAKQPLSKILVGGAWGPKASEIYLGAMFVKQPELSGSTSCSNPSGSSLTGKSHYCTQFTIGINLSVSAIAKTLGAPK